MIRLFCNRNTATVTLPLHAATSVVANNALPQGGQFMGGSSGKFDYNNNGLELNVHQNDQNAIHLF